MPSPRYPSLYQINTRVWLQELSSQLGKRATLDDAPEAFFDEAASRGFDWLWPLGVWQTGPAGRTVSRTQPQWRAEYAAMLPDLREDDITGSPFAIAQYTVHEDFGGPVALARFRERLKCRGVRLMLDFVPNHTALDHPWATAHSEYYIAGDESDLAREPHNYVRIATATGPRILAHGRDPYFPGWPDTLQLNYRSGPLRQAMIGELVKIASACDGVRCDMAMLVLPDVIERTWGNKSLPEGGTPSIHASFWPEAIARVRAEHPESLFLAEVYWDLEWTLQQEGFDYTYDKRLYDRLHAQDARAVRGHLWADGDFQRRSARFLENHDEPRAAEAFPPAVQRAAAVVAFLSPGMRFFHEGQLEGRRTRVSMHLGRRVPEPVDAALAEFYRELLATLKLATVRDGQWRLVDCRPAWEGNPSYAHYLAFAWDGPGGERLLVTVNYAPHPGQCYAMLPWADLPGRQVVFCDRLSTARYERAGNDLSQRGLYLDLPAWGYHVFEMA